MIKNTMKIGMFLSVTAFVGGCEIDPVQTLPERNYTLTWSDEFEGNANTSPDATKWTFDEGTGENGWGNNEFQTYTSNTSNVSLDGKGNLKITAFNFNGNYTSGRIKTKGLFAQKYGRFEARIKTPTGAGVWPAFWMLGENIDDVSWPQCGEIDIMEQKGQNSNITYGSLHGPGYAGENAVTSPYALQNGRFDTDFRVYAVEWGEDFIDFFVDDYLYKRVTPDDVTGEWVYNQPFYLLLNVAIGGYFVGSPNANTPFPQSMIVDYVRVYQEN